MVRVAEQPSFSINEQQSYHINQQTFDGRVFNVTPQQSYYLAQPSSHAHHRETSSVTVPYHHRVPLQQGYEAQ
jgi:hypothetical protein